jgi:hypothetical protein
LPGPVSVLKAMNAMPRRKVYWFDCKERSSSFRIIDFTFLSGCPREERRCFVRPGESPPAASAASAEAWALEADGAVEEVVEAAGEAGEAEAEAVLDSGGG